jgi:DNA-binding GntR family transcriptional regulator
MTPSEAENAIVGYLASQPDTVPDEPQIVEATGVEGAFVRSVLDRLVGDGLVIRSGVIMPTHRLSAEGLRLYHGRPAKG